ncbi:MAG: bifunctional heptose 7-phosphate kinase/heptose 1-phosphate adenyltransferase [Gemmatimonadaceae bacterium]
MMPSLISRPRLETLLAEPATRGLRIAIIGDAMLDVYLRGDVERISPEAPVPVVRVQSRVHALGGAANVAQNVAALGARAELVAAVGDDVAGTQLRAMLTTLGADAGGLVTTARPTTTKTRIVARGQQVVRVDEEIDGDLIGTEVSALASAVTRAIGTADALVLEDYNKGVLVEAVIRDAIAQARAKGIPVIVDPKYRNFFAFAGATIFKPNRRELEAALGAAVDVDHPEALPAVLDRLAVERLLLTLGERGMALIEPSGTIHRIPTTAREVFDVVGAGDTVTAYLAGMLAGGATPLEAAIIANHAAGIQVGKAGAATVTPAEILEVLD